MNDTELKARLEAIEYMVYQIALKQGCFAKSYNQFKNDTTNNNDIGSN